ncbi:unnamed protein product [Spodoptera exigua]|nr:unnamed protein product [Spodoptera exigua]
MRAATKQRTARTSRDKSVVLYRHAQNIATIAVAVSRSIEDRYVKTSSARGGAESRYGDDGARTRPIAECRDDDLRAGDAGVRHLSQRAGNVARGGSAPRRNLSLTVAGSPSPSSSQCYL